MRVIVADDHPAVRQGVRCVLQQREGIEIVAEAEDGAEVINKVEQLHPEMVVLDITMPRLDGLAAAKVIKQRWPSTKIVILSMHGVPSVMKAAKDAGVDGYVAKSDAGDSLLNAIESIGQNGKYFFEGGQHDGQSAAARCG